jgi:hypothetical protein
MPEEILTSGTGTEMSDDRTDYIAALNEMKQNSVSKEQYQKLKDDNKKLLDALVSNKQIDIPEEKPVNVDELRTKLFKNEQGLSNLEFIDTALQLRDALIAKGEPDPFLPIGSKVQPDYDMVEKADNVAKCLKEMVDFAEGDSGIFNAEYQRRVVDTMPTRKNYK